MTENFAFLFQYLKKENISIDQNEFIFQVKSHPDYPSLLAISDTLHFFNILNGAIRVTVSEIAFLPDRFVSFLKEDGTKPRLYYIEKKDKEYFCSKENKTEFISSSSLEERWNNIVLLVEKSESVNGREDKI
jgi:ABC-type bacteriocin/lantibiotic exporter with double-glycine peptidase domain